jgi:hypothetical protein
MDIGMLKKRSYRGREWLNFSESVEDHIEKYTVRQYGDYPSDQVTEWSAEQCVDQVKKYANRFGKGARGPAEELRDLLKIAHYACLAWNKRLNGQSGSSIERFILSDGKVVETWRAGKSFLGRCPKHESGAPSLIISNDEKTFTCLSCGAFGFVLCREDERNGSDVA